MKKGFFWLLIVLFMLAVAVKTGDADDWSLHFENAEELENIEFTKKALSAYVRIAENIELHDRVNSVALAKAAFGEGRCFEKLKKHESALEAYMKIAYIYKGELEPAAWYKIGVLFETKLKMPSKAKSIYQKLQNDFPLDTHAGDALYQSAQMAEHDKSFNEAIDIYLKMVESYPDNDKADEALANVAEIEMKHNKSAMKAIEVYRRIDAEYSNSSIPALWKVGLIYEKELDDLGQAKAVYQELIEKYPKSKESNNAEKRIIKIDKQLSK
ncbi:MAG: tetratricopeptide repeat protein [Candidatus Anammoxibacter sp.]